MKKANELLVKFNEALKKRTVLDLGSGDGSNIAYLRDLGFTVKGVEKNYGETIEDFIKENESDEKVWDNIISFYTLHFLSRENATTAYSWIKKHTEKQGLNIIIDFTNEGEWDLTKTSGIYFKRNELKEMYSDWEILHYEEKLVPTYNGSKQMAAFVVAKKP